MAYNNPPDGWEVAGIGAVWGTDVLEDLVTVNRIGDGSTKITGDGPTSNFGLITPVSGYVPVTSGQIYRLGTYVRASSIVAGRNVYVSLEWFQQDKSTYISSSYAIQGVLSAANTWLTYTVEAVAPANAKFAAIQFAKTDIAFDAWCDYIWVRREPMSFHAYLNADQALVTTGYRPIIFNAEEPLASGAVHDLGSNFDTATGLYTAPYRQMMYFDASVQMSAISHGKYASMRYYKNGATYKQCGRNEGVTGSNTTVDGSLVIELDAGDTIGVRVFHNEGVNRNAMGVADGEESWFLGFEVSR